MVLHHLRRLREQCPVDIEHIDTIVDMRRYQVLMESEFPTEAGLMLRNVENQGDPWGLGQNKRAEWTQSLDFEIPVITGTIPDDIEYLYWVGCAGALDERARKGVQATARMLHRAGVTFAILGPKESCTGDPVRRLGNEYLYQEQAKMNIATLDEAGAKKIIASCPHCFNTIKNEYPALGGNYEVIHHAELLEHLVPSGKLTPGSGYSGKVTYHDPCYLGPAQPDHRGAALGAQRHPRRGADRDAALQGARLLLRRRRRPHVARGEHRQADQHGAHGRGARHGGRRRVDRLPLLHDHARRRRAGQRQGGRRARARPLPAGGGVARTGPRPPASRPRPLDATSDRQPDAPRNGGTPWRRLRRVRRTLALGALILPVLGSGAPAGAASSSSLSQFLLKSNEIPGYTVGGHPSTMTTAAGLLEGGSLTKKQRKSAISTLQKAGFVKAVEESTKGSNTNEGLSVVLQFSSPAGAQTGAASCSCRWPRRARAGRSRSRWPVSRAPRA